MLIAKRQQRPLHTKEGVPDLETVSCEPPSSQSSYSGLLIVFGRGSLPASQICHL